jgi:hypothetical protein
MTMNRRDFLTYSGIGAVGVIGISDVFASAEDSKIGMAILDHGAGSRSRPGAVEQLMWEVSKRTSIRVRETPRYIKITDEALFENPFVLWLGTGACSPFSTQERGSLSRFLRGGGTLLISDASVPGDDAFDGCVRREMDAIWADRDWLVLGNDHTAYRTFYLLRHPEGRIGRTQHLEGLMFDDRSPVLYERNDLFGAFGREKFSGWSMPVFPGGNRQREMAFRLGINLVMYATCLNYKRDQVHTTEILRRRNWRIQQPRPIR